MNSIETIKALLESPSFAKLVEIGNLINTQDNRMTDQPMFIVQRKYKNYGIDSDYSHEYDWVCCEDDYHVACDRLHEILDTRSELGKSLFGYEKHYFNEDWEYVTACFTEQGCKDYLARDGHNIREETRIYADGSYRNNEFREVRKFLGEIALLQSKES